jgi:hypothetical protein
MELRLTFWPHTTISLIATIFIVQFIALQLFLFHFEQQDNRLQKLKIWTVFVMMKTSRIKTFPFI